MTMWSSSKFSKTGNIYGMNSASVATQQRLAHDKSISTANRIYDPYAETQMASATVNKNFQNPLSEATNPKRSANPAWAPQYDLRFHPVMANGYNGAAGVSNNPGVIPGAYTKHIDRVLIDKQHVTAGTALNNDYSTDIITPKNYAIADGVKFSVGNDTKASAATADKYWALNQNLYSPLVLDSKGNRTDATMAIVTGNSQTNPSSQYLTQRNQIPVPLPNYNAFEPEAVGPTFADRFQDFKASQHFPIFMAVAVIAGILIVAKGGIK